MFKYLLSTKEKSIYMLVIFISFFLININVINFGDDFYFMQYKNYNFIDILKYLFSFYYTDNGRFIVHFLVIYFLKAPMIFWQAINSVMLVSICFFITKLASTNDKNKILILFISFFLISSIGIEVTRQSVFWITGSFNYIYPCVMFLIYTFLLTKINNKKNYFYSLIFGFLSSGSVEQVAMMTVGITFLFLLSKFNNFKNIKQTLNANKKLIILLIVTLVGSSSVLLAPAQFNRIELETKEISLIDNAIENIKLMLNFYTQSTTIFYFHLTFLFFGLFLTIQFEQNKIIKYFMICTNLICIVLIINLCCLGFLVRLLKYIFLIIICICLLYYNHKIYHNTINLLTIATILLIGSQIMMIISPVLGYRNFIFGLVLYLIIIGIVINQIRINPSMLLCTSFIIMMLAILFNYRTAFGYNNTKKCHEKNVTIIQNSDNIISNTDSIITLYRYPNDDYSWCAPYTSEFHLVYLKKEYNIKCNINWKTTY